VSARALSSANLKNKIDHMANNRNGFHKDVPKRLIDAVQKAGSERKFARECGINQSYVSQLLHRGIEPGNPWIRVKLFLPARRIKHREPKPEEFPGQKRIIKKIRELHRTTTRAFKHWKNNGR